MRTTWTKKDSLRFWELHDKATDGTNYVTTANLSRAEQTEMRDLEDQHEAYEQRHNTGIHA